MKQVVKVRMLPTAEQAAALHATLHTCNEAASWLSAAMHTARVRGKRDVPSFKDGSHDKASFPSVLTAA